MSFLSVTFSLQQNQRTRGHNRFCPEAVWGGEVAQTTYIHVNKCKNDKIKKGRKQSDIYAYTPYTHTYNSQMLYDSSYMTLWKKQNYRDIFLKK
jgi:hypothetical protein